MPDLPGFTKKRKILYSKKTPKEELIRVGDNFLDAEYYDDALEFYTRADASEGVRKVAEKSYEAGDLPLFMRAKRALDEEITTEEWETLAQKALEGGRESMAYMAYRNAGMDEKAAQIRGEPIEGQTESEKAEQGEA